MRHWTPINNLESLKGKEERVFILFDWKEKTKVKLCSVGNHEALFQLLHDGEYKWVFPLHASQLTWHTLYKLSNTVKYGDLRNLKRDQELEGLFDTYIKTVYDTLKKWQAEDFLNNNTGFRETLANIRRWRLYFDQAKQFLANTEQFTLLADLKTPLPTNNISTAE